MTHTGHDDCPNEPQDASSAHGLEAIRQARRCRVRSNRAPSLDYIGDSIGFVALLCCRGSECQRWIPRTSVECCPTQAWTNCPGEPLVVYGSVRAMLPTPGNSRTKCLAPSPPLVLCARGNCPSSRNAKRTASSAHRLEAVGQMRRPSSDQADRIGADGGCRNRSFDGTSQKRYGRKYPANQRRRKAVPRQRLFPRRTSALPEGQIK